MIRGLRLKLEMGKLLDDIAPYHLRTRQLSKESLLLNQREEKLFKSTAAGTPEGLSASSFFAGIKRDHSVLETFSTPEHTLRSGHLSPLCQRFSFNLDDIHGKVDHPGIRDGGPNAVTIRSSSP